LLLLLRFECRLHELKWGRVDLDQSTLSASFPQVRLSIRQPSLMNETPFSRELGFAPGATWHCAAGRVSSHLLYTKPSTTPPARARAERHHPGVVGEPAASCIPYPPGVVKRRRNMTFVIKKIPPPRADTPGAGSGAALLAWVA
jgi:hypothetical protein